MSTQDKAGPSIVRVQKNANYSVIFNEVARRRDLSARAKGIFYYVMTLPDDWKFYKREIYSHFSEGRQALDTAWAELEKAGYIHKEPARAEGGKLAGWNYTVVETVQSVQSTESPETRVTVSPHAANQPLLSTDSSLSTNSTKYDRHAESMTVTSQSVTGKSKTFLLKAGSTQIPCSNHRYKELVGLKGEREAASLIEDAFYSAAQYGKDVKDFAWFALRLNGLIPYGQPTAVATGAA